MIQDGRQFDGEQAKCEISEPHFEKRLAAPPQVTQRAQTNQGAVHSPDWVTRHLPTGSLCLVTQYKAADSLAAQRALGPEGIPAKIYRKLTDPR